ncbi:MAG: hydrogenase maturation protease [Planctomycetaceae bacterium]|nr:MAG: hydrogenase maturation protease [Planctomycetaceae bacterium]
MASLAVLGLGNILMSDEGVGVRLMEAVRDCRVWPDDVEFIDGGAGGLGLLDIIEQAGRLVVFDAADMRLPAGEFRIITPEQLADESAGMSMHDMPFVQTLALCRQFTRCPSNVKILAVQPADISPCRQLSTTIRKAFDSLIHAGEKLVQSMYTE